MLIDLNVKNVSEFRRFFEEKSGLFPRFLG